MLALSPQPSTALFSLLNLFLSILRPFCCNPHARKKHMPAAASTPLTWGMSGLVWGQSGMVWGGSVANPNPIPIHPMATSNRISVEITDAVKTQFIDLLTQAAALLPAAPTLTPEERQETPTIGPKLQPFDNAAQEVAVQFPQLVPVYQSVTEATKDFNSRAKVSTMQLALDSLREKLGDIDLLMGADRFDFSHSILYSARDAAKRGNIPGADTALSSMEEVYPKRGKKTTPTPPPAP